MTNYTDAGCLSAPTVLPPVPASAVFLGIDNSTPKLQITGDARNVFEANTPDCFIGGVNVDSKWKNYTISGTIRSADPYGSSATDCSQKCSPLTAT